MREVLFRGRRLDTGGWVEGSLAIMTGAINTGETYIMPPWTGIKFEMHGQHEQFLVNVIKVDPDTVGQSIGLVDGNGNAIFEGDIVLDTATGEKYEILYNYGGFAMADKNRFFHSPSLRIGNDYEIIGNIYDDPELLRGERNGTA